MVSYTVTAELSTDNGRSVHPGSGKSMPCRVSQTAPVTMHQMVPGTASPDDSALADNWNSRRQCPRLQPPVDRTATYRGLAVPDAGRHQVRAVNAAATTGVSTTASAKPLGKSRGSQITLSPIPTACATRAKA